MATITDEYTIIDMKQSPNVAIGHTVDNENTQQTKNGKEGKDTTVLPKSELRVPNDLFGDLVGNAESDWKWLLTAWENANLEHVKGCRSIEEFNAWRHQALETGKSLGNRSLAEWLESACPKAWNNGELRIRLQTANEYETEFIKKLVSPYNLFYQEQSTVSNTKMPKRPEQVPDEVSLASIMTMIRALEEKVDALSRRPRIVNLRESKPEEPKEVKEPPKPKVSLKEKMAKMSDRQLLELMFLKLQQNSNRIMDLERLRPNSMRSL